MTLAPDPAVPARDALLRADGVARLVGADGARGSRVYAKYRVGESLRVVHRIGAGAYVSARTFADSRAAYERALPAAVPAAALRPVVHAAELGAVLWTFPNDRRLAALPLLRDGSPALARLLGRPFAAVRLASYAPERCATAMCLDDHGAVLAYVKVHAGDGAERERRRLEAAAAAVRVPRVLAAGDGVLVLEPLPGRRADTLRASERPAALSRLGAALAGLHQAAPVPDAPFRRLEPERLARAVATIARARPDACRPAALVLADLLERRAGAGGPPVCIHGDAHLRNAILGRDGVALLDLEDAAAGPAAADLGQVLARLRAEEALGRMPDERRLAGDLLAGYATVAPPPEPEALRWHTAASLLARVALPAVNRVRPAVLDRLVPLLEAARLP
jgi:aminoglycoside phosphotransferase